MANLGYFLQGLERNTRSLPEISKYLFVQNQEDELARAEAQRQAEAQARFDEHMRKMNERYEDAQKAGMVYFPDPENIIGAYKLGNAIGYDNSTIDDMVGSFAGGGVEEPEADPIRDVYNFLTASHTPEGIPITRDMKRDQLITADIDEAQRESLAKRFGFNEILPKKNKNETDYSTKHHTAQTQWFKNRINKIDKEIENIVGTADDPIVREALMQEHYNKVKPLLDKKAKLESQYNRIAGDATKYYTTDQWKNIITPGKTKPTTRDLAIELLQELLKKRKENAGTPR